ncbi:hypothetical protein M409DRAFT_26727 [Zasmidium cellare ATCC 36951]|uniref:BTB domain-containing protein n=1 Tax=Zasmidium cellare ATCC 36951 TaxID=1080233 RepID=A0A6A6CAF2_ZASCE|nr:uncharacterized protein M409DRAFT_26727 [Zasmidium cellare ATCC 36951]KAF2162872.1 hypothetical protein M409DRAFT_26727 [Zasmidium cellare ATCC 36951]
MKPVEDAGLLAHYFITATFSDVTIHLDNGDQVKAHKVILAAHSEHFRKMFESVFVKSSARDVCLHDDDAEELYGLLAWCYGLLYDGTHTFPKQSSADYLFSYGARVTYDPSRLQYLVNLHTTADKYMVLQLKVHAMENFALAMEQLVRRYVSLMADEEEEDRFMSVLEEIATLTYNGPEHRVKELRPALANGVHSHEVRLVDKERFKKLMVELPELCFDMLALGTVPSAQSAQEMGRWMFPGTATQTFQGKQGESYLFGGHKSSS